MPFGHHCHWVRSGLVKPQCVNGSSRDRWGHWLPVPATRVAHQFSLLPRSRALDHLPKCIDGSAYGFLLTTQTGGNFSTFMSHGSWYQRVERQLRFLQVLIRSVRIVEARCRREMVVLLGQEMYDLLHTCRRNGKCSQYGMRHLDWVSRRTIGAFSFFLERERIRLRPVAHILPAVPSADKLNAWRMVREYRHILMIDLDVLVLRPLDHLFERAHDDGSLTIAQHPYDLVQAHCGIPIGSRAVGAMFLVRPNSSTFVELVHSLQSHGQHELQHRSEQTSLACFFYQRRQLRTLDCAVLYDVGNIHHLQNSREYWDCINYGLRSADFGYVGTQTQKVQLCGAIAQHIAEQCIWSKVHRRVHAVHFKGRRTKPWMGPQVCTEYIGQGRLMLEPLPDRPSHRDMILGRPGDDVKLGSNEATGGALPRNDTDELKHHGTDDLVWNEHATVCESAVHGIPVRWASGDPVQRCCCTFMTALQAEWCALRAEHCRREGAPTENGGQPRLVGNDCSVYLPDGTGF